MLLPFILAATAVAAPLSPDQVPSPRAQSSWVADVAEVVTPELETRIDHIVVALQAELGAEIAVVTVSEVEGTAKDFATELFNRWGIGDREANNGVLVLLVVDARRVEIETGYGVEGILTDGWLGRMMDEGMVPQFKAGELGEGLVAGVGAIDARLRDYPEETRLGTGGAVDVGADAVDPWPRGGLAVLVGGGLSAPLLLGGGLFVAARRRRQCPVCKEEMTQLSEEAEDVHLDDGQQYEEMVGSVDYEVRGLRSARAGAHHPQPQVVQRLPALPQVQLPDLDAEQQHPGERDLQPRWQGRGHRGLRPLRPPPAHGPEHAQEDAQYQLVQRRQLGWRWLQRWRGRQLRRWLVRWRRRRAQLVGLRGRPPDPAPPRARPSDRPQPAATGLRRRCSGAAPRRRGSGSQ